MKNATAIFTARLRAANRVKSPTATRAAQRTSAKIARPRLALEPTPSGSGNLSDKVEKLLSLVQPWRIKRERPSHKRNTRRPRSLLAGKKSNRRHFVIFINWRRLLNWLREIQSAF